MNHKPEKILFMLLPFWTPLIPPLGITCLKSYLTPYGYEVKTVDANVELDFYESYQGYFELLRQFIPKEKQGNFYNTGHDILRNHLMAHFEHEHEEQYLEIVRFLVSRYYFETIDVAQAKSLNQIITDFYLRLEKYVIQILEAEQPGVLGISVFSGTLAASLFSFRLAKEKYPMLKTVMGGGIFADQLCPDSPNFNAFITNVPEIDALIIGEGELLFLKYLQGQLPKTQKVYTLQDLGAERLDLSAIDIPDFSDIETRSYPQLAYFTSRSCPFQCNFCSETVQWGKYRKKEPEQISRELTRLAGQYNSQLFLLGDSLLNPVITGLAKELEKSDTVVYWDGYLRADPEAGNLENTFLWRRGGFYRARLGVESGSDQVLNLMGKKITAEQIKTAVANLAYAGIKTTTYWVIGHPGETEADFQLTLALIEQLKDDLYEAECNPFNYYVKGQVGSDHYAGANKVIPLYPEAIRKVIRLQTWSIDANPGREIIYQRICRFVAHCNKLGIPNPYSLQEIQAADERWAKLHSNAVPPLMDFTNKRAYINECKKITNLQLAGNTQPEVTDFTF